MASKKKNQKRRTKRIKVVENCYFCDNKEIPSYKNFELLRKFLSDRGKILSKLYSGVCTNHQRVLSREIKRARHLLLLPSSSNA